MATLEDNLTVFTKQNILLSYDPAIMFLGIFLNELITYFHIKICSQVFIAASFIMAITYNNQNVLSL